MRKASLGSAVLAAFIAVPTVAADLPTLRRYEANRAPLYAVNWNGCYIGGNAGVHRSQDQITTTTSPANFGGGAGFLDTSTPTSLNPKGAVWGLQVGCNL